MNHWAALVGVVVHDPVPHRLEAAVGVRLAVLFGEQVAVRQMSTLDLQRQYADGRADKDAAVHSSGSDDGPVQIISLALLEHYRRCEAELKRLQAISDVLPAR